MMDNYIYWKLMITDMQIILILFAILMFMLYSIAIINWIVSKQKVNLGLDTRYRAEANYLNSLAQYYRSLIPYNKFKQEMNERNGAVN